MKARVRVVLRRHDKLENPSIVDIAGIIKIDIDMHKVSTESGSVDLTPTEFKILRCLSARVGYVYSRYKILEYLWGEEKLVIDRTIDVHIRHLREKLGSAGEIIKNVRGFGYKIEIDIDDADG